MKLNNKYIHIYFIFMDLINMTHQPIHPHMTPNEHSQFGHILGVLLHIYRNRSCDMHLWIVAFGGNQTKWTNVSLFAECWPPAKILEEQEQKLYVSKIAGCGQSLGIGKAICKAKNGIKERFRYLTISGNYGSKMMENMDITFSIGFEDQD
eukprot:492570_1